LGWPSRARGSNPAPALDEPATITHLTARHGQPARRLRRLRRRRRPPTEPAHPAPSAPGAQRVRARRRAPGRRLALSAAALARRLAAGRGVDALARVRARVRRLLAPRA